jgi:AcrR family transcriptional regulator
MAIGTPFKTGDAQLEALTPERRRALTRRHLLEAAGIVFARQGFHGATLDEVAATAGFTKGAVYSNFENKADLFLAVLDDRLERLVADVTERIIEDAERNDEHLGRIQETLADLSPPEGWDILWLEFVLYAVRNPEARDRLADFRRRQQAQIEDLIRAEHERLGTEPRYPVSLLALVSVTLYDGVELQRLIDPESMTPEVDGAVLRFIHENNGQPWPDAADPAG